jgi:hypothetical protein
MSSKQTTNTQGTQSQTGSQSGSTSGTGGFTGTTGYDWFQNPGSEDITALRGYKEQIDPAIGAQHSRRQTNLRASYSNPLGQYTTPAMRDAALRSQEGELEQDYGQAQRNAYSDQQGRTGQRMAGLAALTAPQLQQTGSTGATTESSTTSGDYSGSGTNTGSTTQSQPLLPSILGAGASVGAAAL